MKTLYNVKLLEETENYGIPSVFQEKLIRALETQFEVKHFQTYDHGFEENLFQFVLKAKNDPKTKNLELV